MPRGARTVVVFGLASIASIAACTLFVDSGGLSGDGDSGGANDAAGDTSGSSASDAPSFTPSSDDDASDASDAGVDAAPSFCATTPVGTFFCEDFANYDVAKMGCINATPTLDTSTPASAPAALVINAQQQGGCTRYSPITNIGASGLELSFKVRADALTDRSHTFSIAMGTGAMLPFVYLNLYVSKVSIGVASRNDAGQLTYSEPLIRVGTTPIGKWMEGTITIDNLGAGGRVSATLDGASIGTSADLVSWGPGNGELRLGLNFSVLPSKVSIDDVLARTLP